MDLYRRIDDLDDIENMALVMYDDGQIPLMGSIAGVLDSDCTMLNGNDEAIAHFNNSSPDLFVIGSSGESLSGDNFELCRRLRKSGYQGIVVLVTNSASDWGGTSNITSEGFDNYLLSSDSSGRIKDTIHWAILNRKRRIKYNIQFDTNLDSFFTVDVEGNIYDINECATEGVKFTPKEIVKNRINVTRLGTLKFFKTIIRPLIEAENVGSVFSNTVEDGMSVFQVRTRIHNVPTFGLVATVVKTDITKTMYSRTMDILLNSVTMLSQRDNYTAGHSARVFYYCRHIANAMGHSKNWRQKRALYLAALLHDIGKIGIKDNVLLKPGSLTGKEHEELTTHPVKGYKMLRSYKFLRESLDLVRSHHERPDGKGYPDKLKGNRISSGALIIAVADGFDAMTTNRPYRKPMSLSRAVGEIEGNLGTQFDGEVGKAFMSILNPSLISDIRGKSSRPLHSISQELIDTILNEDA
jgi:HD-GYP domain-containing protein (c-di-GMP phosphodiesterase class II)